MKPSPLKQRVLIVGPAMSLGGIATVIRLHRSARLWQIYQCNLLSTYDERSSLRKLMSMARAYVVAPIAIARSSLVHIHVAAQHSMLRKLPIMLLTKLLRKPYIIHLHAASEESLFEQTPPWAVRMAFLLSYRVVVLSERWADIVTRHVPDARVTIIRNPVLLPHRTAPSTPAASKVILFVGKLEMRKGYRDLIQAAAQLMLRFPAAELWLVGNGQTQDADEYARQLGIASSVKCPGWIAPEKMEAFYRAATIFCLPSYNEGLPMGILEAMSYGLPVVSTTVGGIPDIITDGYNGFLVEPGDIQSLAARLSLLLSDSDRAATLGKTGAATIAHEYTLDVVEHKLSELYNEVGAEWITRRHGLRESDVLAANPNSNSPQQISSS